MKGFIISIVIFGILTGAVIWNGLWVRSRTGELLDIVSEIPEDPERAGDGIARLRDKWDQCKSTFGLTISHAELENIGAGVTAAAIYAKTGEYAELAAALQALRDAMTYLRRSESLCFESII